MTHPGESVLQQSYDAVRLEQTRESRSNADVILDLRISLEEWYALVDAALGQIIGKNERLRADIEAAGADVEMQCLMDAIAIGFRIGREFGARTR